MKTLANKLVLAGSLILLAGCRNIQYATITKEEFTRNYRGYEFERCCGLYDIKINDPTKYQEIIKKLEKEDNARK